MLNTKTLIWLALSFTLGAGAGALAYNLLTSEKTVTAVATIAKVAKHSGKAEAFKTVADAIKKDRPIKIQQAKEKQVLFEVAKTGVKNLPLDSISRAKIDSMISTADAAMSAYIGVVNTDTPYIQITDSAISNYAKADSIAQPIIQQSDTKKCNKIKPFLYGSGFGAAVATLIILLF